MDKKLMTSCVTGKWENRKTMKCSSFEFIYKFLFWISARKSYLFVHALCEPSDNLNSSLQNVLLMMMMMIMILHLMYICMYDYGIEESMHGVLYGNGMLCSFGSFHFWEINEIYVHQRGRSEWVRGCSWNKFHIYDNVFLFSNSWEHLNGSVMSPTVCCLMYGPFLCSAWSESYLFAWDSAERRRESERGTECERKIIFTPGALFISENVLLNSPSP